LEVISRAAFDLQAVFETVVESSARLCGSDRANIYRFDGEVLRIAATFNVPREVRAWLEQHPIRPGPQGGSARAALERRTVHIPDILADPNYSFGAKAVEPYRTVLGVPILKGDDLLGVILLYLMEVRPFTDKQIALVETFADQAAIAIENVRLLEAEQQRTQELSESLARQTATSDVLQVISASPGDLEPVFQSMLDNAVHICAAKFGGIYRCDGDTMRLVATHRDVPAAYAAARRFSPFRPGPKHYFGRMMATKAIVHIADAAADEGYAERRPEYVAAVELGGVHTFLVVPMLKDNVPVGALLLAHVEARPFTETQIELVENFANQAVIAIENARLLSELRERTDELGRSVGELRALGEVSQAVNSTLDLETVLSTIVAKAVQLSGTEAGAIYVFDDVAQQFHLHATYGMERDLIDVLSKRRIGLDETNIAAVLAAHELIQVADLREEARSDLDEIILSAGYRARLTAPLFRGDHVVGMLVVRRRTPGAFSQRTVDLIKTFAAQSVLAIQNARLFANVESRTRELATSLQELRTAQHRLVQTEKLASLGQLTAGIAHEIKNPLNFVNNFSEVSVELIDELQEILRGIAIDDKRSSEVAELADMLRGNLDKVVQHGKRADSIVKNMLLHSRQGSGEHQAADINAIVEESLNLAYHGARAEKQGFNITLERSFDPAAGTVDLFPQEMTRVLLNLISNGFYAATKRKAAADGGDYEPKLAATTRNLGDSVEIRIRDNGTGIPPEVTEKMFNPFFTTKPAGEGTGLGLSLSHDIVVKQHAGSIEVDTRPGEFTEFRIVLPRRAAAAAKSGGRA
jgi:GAF domain-containing protein